ncbi:MAG TPA: hypothetical protein VF041_23130 [Gemmatimonadaceae bacterium]
MTTATAAGVAATADELERQWRECQARIDTWTARDLTPPPGLLHWEDHLERALRALDGEEAGDERRGEARP